MVGGEGLIEIEGSLKLRGGGGEGEAVRPMNSGLGPRFN